MIIEKVCLVIAFLIFLSIYLLKFSKRYNIPTLIIFLGVGMLAGSEGIVGIAFDDPEFVQFMGSLALCIILFSGAFNTNIKEVSPVKVEGLSLAFIGVVLNTLLVALPVYFFTPFDYLGALLFGAIVSSTDASAVMSILSFSGLNIKKRIGGILKLESGSNDPMANVLIILLISVIGEGSFDPLRGLLFLILQVGIGCLAGLLIAKAALFFIKRFEVRMPELFQILIIGFVMGTYGLTNLLQGNGFLAIYILGLYLGNSNIDFKRSMNRFFSSLTWMVEASMFVILGLLVFPSQLMDIWKVGIGAGAVLIFIARPASVFLTLIRSRLDSREKLFIAWGGLKGAVPIVFATFPLVAGVENSHLIFNLVFFVVVFSVVFQGMTLPLISRWFKLEAGRKPYERSDLESLEFFEEKLIKVRVKPEEIILGKSLGELRLPRDILIILINRGESKILPEGKTVIEEGDELYILAESSGVIEEYMEDLRRAQEEESEMDSSSKIKEKSN